MYEKLFLVLMIAPGLWIASGHAQDKSRRKAAPPAVAPAPATDTVKPVKRAPGISDRLKASRKIDGMFTVYQDTTTGSLQLYVRKDQLGKEYIYQSFSLNGPNSLYLNQVCTVPPLFLKW